jgi:tetratricopeptide (TPR) repeat protein
VIRAVAAAVLCATAVAPAAAAAPSLWDDVASASQQRCQQLLAAAGRLAAVDRRGAAKALRTVGQRCAGDRAALQAAGEALVSLRQPSDARLLLERARVLADAAPPASRGQDASLAFHLGFTREVTGDLAGAVEEHRRLEAIGGLPPPNQYLVHYDLGDELMAIGRLSEAIDEYRRAVALAPDKPVPRLALAVALDRDEQRDRAHAELDTVLALDPELRQLGADEYTFVPAADVHYYRALALLARGAAAEARLALRTFLRELPDGPYAAVARERLVAAEQLVDPRELEVSSADLDSRALAERLGPAVTALEDCLPAGRVVHVRLRVAGARLRIEPGHPAAACLNQVLSHVDTTHLPARRRGWVRLPLAGRRTAASRP